MRLPVFCVIAMLALPMCLAPTARADLSFEQSLKDVGEPITRALQLIGTPYKFGGRNPDEGLDCSGLVRYVYRQAAAVELPHNAKDISDTGQPVDKTELKPGDLVFFNTLKRPFSHVGIYKGDGKFIHASSRRDKRVTVSDMGNGYWKERFDGARRILLPTH
ncbi:MAG: C40 family peptidase [Thiobacillaceae bacterium]|jgi:cell wall-associated NlpC family hydrolase|nr:C40 family peptidase [Thiobacillaceae bacterium]